MIPRSKDGTYIVDPPSGGAGSVLILGQGVLVGAFTKINFIGTSVNVVDAGGGQANVTITAYNTVEDEGGALPQRDTINFVGAGVVAADVAGKTVVTIPGGAVGANTDQFVWGANSLLASTAARYLHPYNSFSNAPTVAIQIRCYRAGTLANMRVRHRAVGASANIITYTLRKNGVATTLTASIAANDATLNTQDLVNSVAVAAGDLLDIEVTKSGVIGNSPSDITLTMEWS
jgi:hypothetical protein